MCVVFGCRNNGPFGMFKYFLVAWEEVNLGARGMRNECTGCVCGFCLLRHWLNGVTSHETSGSNHTWELISKSSIHGMVPLADSDRPPS